MICLIGSFWYKYRGFNSYNHREENLSINLYSNIVKTKGVGLSTYHHQARTLSLRNPLTAKQDNFTIDAEDKRRNKSICN